MKLFSDEKLSPEAQKLVLEVAKQLITLSVAAIGFVTSMLFTTFKGTSFVLSAQFSLFNFLLCASTGVLVQLAVVNESLQDPTWFKVSYPRLLLFLSWALFVGGLVSFVVFTLANLKQT